jgi:alanine racemase
VEPIVSAHPTIYTASIMLRERYATWVEVDLEAIADNISYFASLSDAAVMAVVKADGYGHGASQVAGAALRAGASWLAVARAEEALELRAEGLEAPILILGLTPPGYVSELIRAEVSMTVWSSAQVRAMSETASQMGRKARLHLKVDTGMSRLGVQLGDALERAREMASVEGVEFEGLFSHYARADESDQEATGQQRAAFTSLLRALEREALRPKWVHVANSAAGLAGLEHHFDLMRIGIAMYGLHPSRERPLPGSMRPSLTWKTQLAQVKTLGVGRGVSYGHAYVTRSRERIGTLPVGYADGFRRVEGNEVLVDGKRAPVVGRVCMDQCMVSLEAAPGARVGDPVVLIGVQGEDCISAEEVAQRWGTINYEVVCGIGSRVPRLYDPH